jgi:hypothetical protein
MTSTEEAECVDVYRAELLLYARLVNDGRHIEAQTHLETARTAWEKLHGKN